MVQFANPRAAELERLGDEIAELAAHIHAATHRLLVMLAEFDRREGWSRAFRSCAHWLSWRTGIAPGAAREKVRVARALESLPTVSAAMRCGRLSYAKVRAITRVATPDNEARLLELALHATAAHVEKLVRAWRRVDRNEELSDERARHERRGLDLWIGEDGSWVVRGRLDPEVGALLERALDGAGEALHGRSADPSVSGRQRRADAIGLLAEAVLRDRGRADRFQVVVHVDESALREGSSDGQSVLDGVRVPAETSRRIACDTSRVSMADDALEAGRRTRTVPPAIRRALEHRDHGCRFPGCGLRFCDAHHIVHWADGGATRLGNLVLLCRRHHRAVHEEGFRVSIAADGDTVFHAPDGRPIADAPAMPALPAHALPRMMVRHRPFKIDPWTPTPRWNGQPLDLAWAIAVLRPG